MKRFKTKQELDREYESLDDMRWNDENHMDYLFGLQFNGQLGNQEVLPLHATGDPYWTVYDTHLTDKLHPYRGKPWIVKIYSERQFKNVARRLKGMGYGNLKLEYTGVTDITDTNGHGQIMKGPVDFAYGTRMILTYEEFMRGDVVDSPKQSTNEKKDAYIEGGTCYVMLKNGTIDNCLAEFAYMHNLMSAEDFNKKYRKKLKFKQWNVKVSEGMVDVGCQSYSIKELSAFYKVAWGMVGHCTLEEAFTWLKLNNSDINLTTD